MKGSERAYRGIVNGALAVACRVVVCETDLQIYSRTPLAEQARETVLALRGQLEGYIRRHPAFIETLSPWSLDDPAPRPDHGPHHRRRRVIQGPGGQGLNESRVAPDVAFQLSPERQHRFPG
ncbi:MAG TPA: hypothetical protein ENF48_03175, partial [Desulfobacteraceae bacterium]|nr:hypothetical protein [Desulfobacteraceae bacterium]